MPVDYQKTENEVLDYKFDFAAKTNSTGKTDYLQSGETISSATVTVEAGLTKDSDSLTDTNTSVTAWISGGTAGTTYTVTCLATTSGGRDVERMFDLEIVSERTPTDEPNAL